mmetsp:Transcript_57621/g.166828  ORF Transcript_57621/g.166828 Transcript_57621/m.166828 type:complete len:310 (+) Transcript_57621:1253-2182(+)
MEGAVVPCPSSGQKCAQITNRRALVHLLTARLHLISIGCDGSNRHHERSLGACLLANPGTNRIRLRGHGRCNVGGGGLNQIRTGIHVRKMAHVRNVRKVHGQLHLRLYLRDALHRTDELCHRRGAPLRSGEAILWHYLAMHGPHMSHDSATVATFAHFLLIGGLPEEGIHVVQHAPGLVHMLSERIVEIAQMPLAPDITVQSQCRRWPESVAAGLLKLAEKGGRHRLVQGDVFATPHHVHPLRPAVLLHIDVNAFLLGSQTQNSTQGATVRRPERTTTAGAPKQNEVDFGFANFHLSTQLFDGGASRYW